MSQDKDTIDRTYNAAELDSGTSKTIARIVVENDRGLRAIGFLSLRLVRGRVQYKVTVKKDRGEETEASATANWVI